MNFCLIVLCFILCNHHLPCPFPLLGADCPRLTKYDTPVVDENGNLTEAAKEAVDLLNKYARTFQERNPNLYLFNCVLHMDEATPHLHIDYVPVVDGYKKGHENKEQYFQSHSADGS
ncbi:MAG: plasmid recombination protein [Lachnospiraceae bacterium]|nr:plasmid recombination protein [Lachnospiraceae bacterium]